MKLVMEMSKEEFENQKILDDPANTSWVREAPFIFKDDGEWFFVEAQGLMQIPVKIV